MSGQLDLFDLINGPEKVRRETSRTQRSLHAIDSEETWIRKLEESGRYRILRKLMPRQIVERSKSPLPHLGVLVDTETTGLDHAKDEVIEIGMVSFTYDDMGTIGDVVGVFSALRQPYAPIPAEIIQLTGITNEMVAGKTIALDAVEAFIEPADLVMRIMRNSIGPSVNVCRPASPQKPGPARFPTSHGAIMVSRARNSLISSGSAVISMKDIARSMTATR
jgi:DNA polymerase-3 subunit epsilon